MFWFAIPPDMVSRYGIGWILTDLIVVELIAFVPWVMVIRRTFNHAHMYEISFLDNSETGGNLGINYKQTDKRSTRAMIVSRVKAFPTSPLITRGVYFDYVAGRTACSIQISSKRGWYHLKLGFPSQDKMNEVLRLFDTRNPNSTALD